MSKKKKNKVCNCLKHGEQFIKSTTVLWFSDRKDKLVKVLNCGCRKLEIKDKK